MALHQLSRGFIAIAFCLLSAAFAAKASTGECRIEDFARNTPLTNTQVWDIACDGEFTYFATNDGLVIWDGLRWQNYFEGRIFRNLEIQGGRLLCSGVNMAGYVERDSRGQFVLTEPSEEKWSGDWWRIITHEDVIYIQSRERIVAMDSDLKLLAEIPAYNGFGYLCHADNALFVQDGQQLFLISREGREFHLFPISEIDGRIIGIYSCSGGYMIGIEREGLMLLSTQGNIKKLDNAGSKTLAQAKLTCFKPFRKGLFLAGTTSSGLFIIREDGSIDSEALPCGDRLSRSTVLSVASDPAGNIWAGLEYSALKIDTGSDDRYVQDEALGIIHSIHILPDKEMLVGTNKGLSVISSDGKISFVPGSTGSVWKIIAGDDRILVLHDRGIFSYSPASAQFRQLVVLNGAYDMKPLGDGRLAVATYSGFSLIDEYSLKAEGELPGYRGYSRYFDVDDLGRIWVPVQGTGFNCITVGEDAQAAVRNIPVQDPGNDYMAILRIDSRLLLCHGTTAIDALSAESSPGAESILRACGGNVRSITQDGNRFWFICPDRIGFIDRTGTELSASTNVLEGISNPAKCVPMALGDGVAATGFRNEIGLCLGNHEPEAHPIYLASLIMHGADCSRWLDCSGTQFNIPSKMNTITILTRGGNSRKVLYMIPDISSHWSEADAAEGIQISSLPYGAHRILIRDGHSSEEFGGQILEFTLNVAWPWSISTPMIIAYMLVIVVAVFLTRRRYRRKAFRLAEEARAKEREKQIAEKQRRETEFLIREKQLAETERKQLQEDLRRKNIELANITMGSIRHNSSLNRIKTDMAELAQTGLSTEARRVMKRVVGEIDKELNDKTDWERSEEYFNLIHEGLLDRLRKNYPAMSKTDLRICVYIKLNYTNKEISKLMNISPKSVEMAKYRLRKKIGLPSDISIESILQ